MTTRLPLGIWLIKTGTTSTSSNTTNSSHFKSFHHKEAVRSEYEAAVATAAVSTGAKKVTEKKKILFNRNLGTRSSTDTAISPMRELIKSQGL